MQPNYIPYLHLNDYLVQIRSGQLNDQLLDSITDGGIYERQKSEAFAFDEVRSILGSYFYLDFEFRSLLPFNYNKKYFAGDRIILDFPYWISGNGNSETESRDTNLNSYNIGDCIILGNGSGNINGGNCYSDGSPFTAYSCIEPNSDIEFNIENWIAIGNQYDIYFVNFPCQIFKLFPDKQIGTYVNGLYCEGDRVCWSNRIWKCISQSIVLTHHEREQYKSSESVPPPNIFPNQRKGSFGIGFYGNKQWDDEGEFYFQNVLPSYPNCLPKKDEIWCDENGLCWNGDSGNCAIPSSPGYIKNWALGDNRSQTMIEIIVAISVYNLLGRNSFMLKERSIKRDWAYSKLNKIKDGDVTTLIPIIQPEQAGGGVGYGGDVKKINQWR